MATARRLRRATASSASISPCSSLSERIRWKSSPTASAWARAPISTSYRISRWSARNWIGRDQHGPMAVGFQLRASGRRSPASSTRPARARRSASRRSSDPGETGGCRDELGADGQLLDIRGLRRARPGAAGCARSAGPARCPAHPPEAADSARRMRPARAPTSAGSSNHAPATSTIGAPSPMDPARRLDGASVAAHQHRRVLRREDDRRDPVDGLRLASSLSAVSMLGSENRIAARTRTSPPKRASSAAACARVIGIKWRAPDRVVAAAELRDKLRRRADVRHGPRSGSGRRHRATTASRRSSAGSLRGTCASMSREDLLHDHVGCRRDGGVTTRRGPSARPNGARRATSRGRSDRRC